MKMLGIMAKTFLSFGLILFLMAMIFYVLKKFYSPISSSQNSIGGLRVYAQLQLQPRKSIYLVKVLNKILILGVSENGINVLSEINDQEIVKVLDEIYVSGGKRNGKIFKAKSGGEF